MCLPYYRFRHAEPSLFLDKFKLFKSDPSFGQRIDLAKNFRSRKEVLSFTNYIFYQLLDEDLGEMVYDKDSELIYGFTDYDAQQSVHTEVELLMIDRATGKADTTEEDPDQELKKAELEARAYAEKIKQWIGHGEESASVVYDKETSVGRPCQYRDIVILMRSLTDAPVVMEELKKQGIPVYAELNTGYLGSVEILVMLNVLSIIDNKKQDIPFVSVLKSPIVGLTEEALVKIRLAKNHVSFYEAALAYIALNNDDEAVKLARFLEDLADWRKKNETYDLSTLIWYILSKTGYYQFVSGMPGGRQRQANLRALYDRARSYEETSFRGLYRFLRMIDRIKERGEDLGSARALGEQEDVVRIMTIHKSKGLEFPFVIVGGLDKQFNRQDLNALYLLHKDYGFATKHIDPKRRLIYPTLMYHAIRHELKKEQWAEEMRVLYVALTRAREKLVMIGAVLDFSKKQKKYHEVLSHKEPVLPSINRLESQSYLDWIALSLIRHADATVLREEDSVLKTCVSKDGLFKITVQGVSGDHDQKTIKINRDIDVFKHLSSKTPIKETNKADENLIDERLSFKYKNKEATIQAAKQSVTEIKRKQTIKDEFADDQFTRLLKPTQIEKPLFMQGQKHLTKAEMGTAMHIIMQHLDFKKVWDVNKVRYFISLLEEREILTKEEAKAVDQVRIMRFLEHEKVKSILQAKTIGKELPFSYKVPVETVDPSFTGESEDVFIQGVIDLLYQTEKGFGILDYKTDKISGPVTEEMKTKLINKYVVQLNLYTEAVENIVGAKVTTRQLYFFDKDLLLDV